MSRDQGLWGRLFVGNLPLTYGESELRDLFNKYSSLKRVDTKPGYGYIYFSDINEAESAIGELDGMNINGKIIKVEKVLKQDNSQKRVPPNHELRIRIHDLAPNTSWTDLKDWARNAGEVKYANVFNRGHLTLGTVEFINKDGFDSAFTILEKVPLNNERVRVTKEVDEQKRDEEFRKEFGERRQDNGPRNDVRGGAEPSDRYDARGPQRSNYRDYDAPRAAPQGNHSGQSYRSRSRSRDRARVVYDRVPAYDSHRSEPGYGRGAGYSERGGYSDRDRGGYSDRGSYASNRDGYNPSSRGQSNVHAGISYDGDRAGGAYDSRRGGGYAGKRDYR